MKKMISGLLAILFVSGCGGDSDSNNSQTLPSVNESVQGSWLGKCVQTGIESSETHTLIFNENKLFVETAIYDGIHCKKQIQAIKAELDYTVSDSSFQEGEDFNIDYVMKSFSLNPKDSNYVTELNNNSACGFDDWELNVEKNINGQDCTSYLNITVPAVDSSLYNIIKIEEEILKLGNTSFVIGTPVEEERPSGDYISTDFELTDTSQDLDLNGEWSTGCNESLAGGSYEQNTLTFFNSSFGVTLGNYMDASCSSSFYVIDVVLENFEQSGRAPTFQGVKRVNFEFQSIEITPGDAPSATEMNNQVYCGFTDWEANTAKSVMGVDCSGRIIDFPAAGIKAYNLIAVINDRLSLGFNSFGFIGAYEGEPRPFNFTEEGVFEFTKAN